MSVAQHVRDAWDHAPSAVFDVAPKQRLVLTRRWDMLGTARPMVAWMLNPSSAGATEDDPTVRKCIGFAKRAGCGGLAIVNWSPVVATDPRDLLKLENLRLEDSEPYILHALLQLRPSYVLVGWGANGAHVRKRYPEQWSRTLLHARQANDLWCIDETQSRDPVHPLYQPYEKGLHVWRFAT